MNFNFPEQLEQESGIDLAGDMKPIEPKQKKEPLILSEEGKIARKKAREKMKFNAELKKQITKYAEKIAKEAKEKGIDNPIGVIEKNGYFQIYSHGSGVNTSICLAEYDKVQQEIKESMHPGQSEYTDNAGNLYDAERLVGDSKNNIHLKGLNSMRDAVLLAYYLNACKTKAKEVQATSVGSSSNQNGEWTIYFNGRNNFVVPIIAPNGGTIIGAKSEHLITFTTRGNDKKDRTQRIGAIENYLQKKLNLNVATHL